MRRVIGVRLGCGWEREGVLLVRCWVMGGCCGSEVAGGERERSNAPGVAGGKETKEPPRRPNRNVGDSNCDDCDFECRV